MRFATSIVLVIGLIPSVALGQVRRKSEKETAPIAGDRGTARGPEQPRDAVGDPEWLRTRLEKVRRRFDLPDLGAAIVIEDKVVAASVVGVRKYGTQIAAERDDPFHLGSITKVMSATLIGMFVEDGILRWDMTMEEMFPELLRMMQPGYRRVTVVELLAHTGGFPFQPGMSMDAITAKGRNAVERRYQYVKAAIVDPPQAPPGTKTIYSGGAIVVMAYVERKTGKTYEQLMRDRLFAPLGMTTAGIADHMAFEGKVDAPWGHRQSNGKTNPVAPDHHSPINGRQPVGGGYCSMTDLGRFLAFHLEGARGRGRLLRPETFGVLQTAAPGGGFAPGWSTEHPDWAKGKVLAHSGSTGIYLAICWVVPEEGYALCVGTNAAGEPRADEALGETFHYLTTRVHRGDANRLELATAARSRPVPPTPDVRVDGLTPVRATVGYSTFQVGKAGDGKPLLLDGDVFAHGLGVHAPSEVIYNLKPGYRRFVARVGPEERSWRGSVVAKVYLDGNLVDESPLLRAGDPPWNIDVAIRARSTARVPRQIRLVLTDGGDGNHSDWGEWVEAGFMIRKD